MTYCETTQIRLIKHVTDDEYTTISICGQVCISPTILFSLKISTPAHYVIFIDIQTAIAPYFTDRLRLLTIYSIRLGR